MGFDCIYIVLVRDAYCSKFQAVRSKRLWMCVFVQFNIYSNEIEQVEEKKN